jgi:hypothetical protein
MEPTGAEWTDGSALVIVRLGDMKAEWKTLPHIMKNYQANLPAFVL